MSAENSEELVAQIVKRLTASHNVNDIILDICSNTSLGWQEAEELVQRVQAENKTKIVLKQSPLLMLLALGLFLAGMGSVGYTGYEIYLLYLACPESLLLCLALSGQTLVAGFFAGVGMIAGSIIGMQSIWEAFFESLRE